MTTSSNGAMAFQKASKVARTPPRQVAASAQPMKQSSMLSFASGPPQDDLKDADTPKRPQVPPSPSSSVRNTPPKRSRTSAQDIDEMGAILDDLLHQMNEKGGHHPAPDTIRQEATKSPISKAESADPNQKWSEVRGRRAKRKKTARPDAVLVKCTEGASYADILKLVKAAPTLQNLKNKVQGIRKTASGELLLRMQQPSDPAIQELQTAIQEALGDKAAVNAMQETVAVEVLDIDELTTGEEVWEAIVAAIGGHLPQGAVLYMRKAYGATQVATLNLQPALAKKLLELGKVRVVWVVCRMRRRIAPTRCFKCMAYGHTAARCRSKRPVSRDACYKCGGEGHKHNQCNNPPKCILCVGTPGDTRSTAHSVLSRSCPEYKKALSKLDLLAQTVLEQNIDIALLSEPFTNKHEGIQSGLSPRFTQQDYEEIISNIANDARDKSPVLIAGDFNAWATTWGSTRNTPRGTSLLDEFASLNVCLLSTGSTPTNSRAGRESIIDLTFVSPELARHAKWRVLSVYTHSDHLAVLTDISATRNTVWSQRALQTGYKEETLDRGALLSAAGRLTATGDAEACASAISRTVTAACDAPKEGRKIGGSCHRPVPWWNEQISQARRECCGARRAYQRSRGTLQFVSNGVAFKAKRRALRDAIRSRKAKCFQELCDAADAEPFGGAYKLVMGKLNRQPMPKCPTQLKEIVDALFPRQPPLQEGVNEEITEVTERMDNTITARELLEVTAKLKNGKAAGPDGVPNAALKCLISAHPDVFTRMFNQCLAERTVPRAWKRQRLVLLPKPGKELSDPSAYRPLCMLDTMGKIFERLICNRLEAELAERHGLSDQQFGLRKQRSTTDAIKMVTDLARAAIAGSRWAGGTKEYCLVCTLDVRNAFNTSSWRSILEALTRRGISLYKNAEKLFYRPSPAL
ncbi:uncharacterized protein LOC121405376 [Drosophila obscura]|uniref:uncharacterized protein LOC121405376 n=1 Tax=Drosophila obscura TaxID=7282 RepID=UPI001BB23E39|nr:uncharacterized protein LOC121405376 [Drosophila obscura]